MKTRDTRIYHAPWSRLLIGSSAVATFVCVGTGLGLPLLTTAFGAGWIAGLLLALPLLCLPFMVRGYRITPDAILVLRLGWVTKLPRKGLESAAFEPDVTSGSLRLCGNGGFFSFTGLYWNKRLGRHRAFVTDRQLTVVLRYAARAVVVSPERPEQFVRELLADR